MKKNTTKVCVAILLLLLLIPSLTWAAVAPVNVAKDVSAGIEIAGVWFDVEGSVIDLLVQTISLIFSLISSLIGDPWGTISPLFTD